MAAARGVPLATFTRELLEDAQPQAVPAGPGGVQNEIERLFGALPESASIRRSVCMALARTVEAGGAAGVTAGRELVSLAGHTARLYEDEDQAEFEDG